MASLMSSLKLKFNVVKHYCIVCIYIYLALAIAINKLSHDDDDDDTAAAAAAVVDQRPSKALSL